MQLSRLLPGLYDPVSQGLAPRPDKPYPAGCQPCTTAASLVGRGLQQQHYILILFSMSAHNSGQLLPRRDSLSRVGHCLAEEQTSLQHPWREVEGRPATQPQATLPAVCHAAQAQWCAPGLVTHAFSLLKPPVPSECVTKYCALMLYASWSLAATVPCGQGRQGVGDSP